MIDIGVRQEEQQHAEVENQRLHTEIALFVSRNHPVAALKNIDQTQLQKHRELRLATIVNPYDSRAKGRVWSAPSYLMLLEMAQGGFGWAPLPR